MSQFKGFYYNAQIRRYLVQFMAVFAGMKVELAKLDDTPKRTITVPITYGLKDRVVAHLLSDNTQNKLLRLPTLSCYISGLELAPERRKGVNQHRRNTYMPSGKVPFEDVEVVHQVMPVPYNMNVELSMFVSNTEHEHMIMEQIMMLFDPTLQIQTNDDVFDWAKLTQIEMTGIRHEQNYPSGTERRIIQAGFDFTMPIWISAPAEVKKDYVADMYVRLGIVSNATPFEDSYEIIAELDQQDLFDYEKWFCLDDIDLTGGC